MSERIISEVKSVVVRLSSPERLYETAMIQASWQANHEFGIDDCGHSTKVEEWERSDSSIKLKLKDMSASGSMGGWSYTISFDAWCEKCDEEWAD